MGYIKNFFLELKAWKIVRRVVKKNKKDFDKIGLKMDWGGKLYKVINRDPLIELGTAEDEVYLRKELSEIWSVLVKHNIVDILAYELTPLEDERQINDKQIEYEHGYLVTFTPAWKLDKQYVTFWSVIIMSLLTLGLLTGIVWSVFKYLIPYLQTL